MGGRQIWLPLVMRLHLFSVRVLQAIHLAQRKKKHYLLLVQVDITTDAELFPTGDCEWDEPRYCWAADVTYICNCGARYHTATKFSGFEFCTIAEAHKAAAKHLYNSLGLSNISPKTPKAHYSFIYSGE